MSDFNPLDRARINTHRSSFDLSSKKLFTAKVGEILPCYWQIAIPGNKYKISSDWFTRTVPVNTAAYTRIKEYYDFYAVPLRLLSRALPHQHSVFRLNSLPYRYSQNPESMRPRSIGGMNLGQSWVDFSPLAKKLLRNVRNVLNRITQEN